ncbi:hypothetical protein GQ600_27624 [Phytophthora cactorum]|nr:hypothetical protein GQ600_27624 [Phytophthora cactorum]
MGKLMYTVATSNQTPMHNNFPLKIRCVSVGSLNLSGKEDGEQIKIKSGTNHPSSAAVFFGADGMKNAEICGLDNGDPVGH